VTGRDDASGSESRPPAGGLYFQSEQGSAAPARRLLLLSYNFPPDPSVGGLRWQEMSRHFAAEGWALDVIARDFRNVAGADRSRLARLPRGVRIFTIEDREPWVVRLVRAVWPFVRKTLGQRTTAASDALTQEEIFQQSGPRSLVRAYHVSVEFARDELWASMAADLGAKLAAERPFDVIVSSGPPHMTHDAGRIISERTGIPHVVDMRDPWSFVQRLQEVIASPRWIHRARAHEMAAIQNASLVVMNTQPACDAMRAGYPAFEDRIQVVRNGADDDPIPAPRRDKVFRLRFAGSIYMDRDPRLVFRAAKQMIDRLNLRPERFSIEFVGAASLFITTPTTVIAEEEGVGEFVRVGGRLRRTETMEFLAGATMLLSLPQDSDFAIPAKIYEYVRFSAWLLVLATPQSATADVLRGSGADVVEPSDVDAMARVLEARYQQFSRGEIPVPVNASGRFSRLHQSQRLMELIERQVLTEETPGPVSAAGPAPQNADPDAAQS
jgi:glycosyltransferase involved in cell wall biosynthesis